MEQQLTSVAQQFWDEHRRQVCLDPVTTYLNTGSFAPLPRPVLAAAKQLREQLAQSPSDFFWRQVPPRLAAARTRLAAYLAADPADLVLVPNTTFGINLVVHSLDLPAGAEILLTDQEYGAMRYCWEDRARQRGWQIHIVPIPYHTEEPEAIVAAIRAAITCNTRVLFFSHVTSPTGLVLPAQQLCELAAEHGLLSVIDGAHAPGMIPVALDAIEADYYAGNCHKWLMAPSGAAFLYARRSLHRQLQPLIISWGWDFDAALAERDSGWGGSFWARNLEFHGTIDRTPLLVLPEVLDFRAALGEEAVYQRVDALVAYARGRVGAILPPRTPAARTLSGSMTAFEVPPLDVVKARDWIWQSHRIEAPFTTAAGHCFLRISTAWFNTTDEIDRVAQAAQQIPVAALQ